MTHLLAHNDSYYASPGRLSRNIHFDNLSVGMDYQEAVEILGDPDECKSVLNAKNCIWGDSSKNITIKIVADKVVFLSSTGLN